jgi:serine protease AprX
LGNKFPLLFAILGLVIPAAAANRKAANDLPQSGNDPVDIIIQFTTPPTQKHYHKVSQRGGTVKHDLSVVNGLQASMTPAQLNELAADPEVTHISPDRKLTGHLNNGAPAVNAPYAWSLGLDGSNMAVAVIDSGIGDKKTAGFKESDLNKWNTGSSRVVYSRSWVSDGNGALDAYGHGTHVAGIIAGNGFNSTGSQYTKTFKGIAPNVNLVILRVLDGNGVGTDSSVIAAIQTAIKLKNTYNIRVINLSLGRPVFESYTVDPLCQAVEAAYKAGMVVVVAAGNDGRDNSAGSSGYGTIDSPANDPYVITVGAMKSMGTPTRTDDLIATYSSKGPSPIDHIVKPDIVAPGNQMVSVLADPTSAIATTYIGNIVPLSFYTSSGTSAGSMAYFTLSGTSMAAPVVSGAAALLLQAQPSLTPDQVKARLMKTAWKTFPASSSYTDPATGVTYTSQYDAFTIGAGYLDIQAALSSTDLSSGVAKSPTARYDPATNSVYFVSDSSATWGTSAMWGTTAVWGANVFVGSQSALWGSSAMWGTSTTQGFSAMWGTSAKWGTSTTDDTESTDVLINGEN